MVFTVSGIVMLLSELQFIKVLSEIVVIPLGNTTLLSFLQEKNTLFPIFSMLLGKLIFSSEVQLLNA